MPQKCPKQFLLSENDFERSVIMFSRSKFYLIIFIDKNIISIYKSKVSKSGLRLLYNTQHNWLALVPFVLDLKRDRKRLQAPSKMQENARQKIFLHFFFAKREVHQHTSKFVFKWTEIEHDCHNSAGFQASSSVYHFVFFHDFQWFFNDF